MLVDVLAPVEQEGTKASVKTWLKQPGERVEIGEPLLELETDKVAMEVSAPASGVLAEILVADGGEAEKGALLGRIMAGDSVPAGTPAAQTDSPGARASVAAPVAATPLARSIATFDPALRLSPAVRRRLLETGLDPAAIAGTGRGGRITSTDVDQAAARLASAPVRSAEAPVTPRASAAPAAPPAGPLTGRRIPHDTMRRRIAEHMVRSLTTAPHVTSGDFSASSRIATPARPPSSSAACRSR
jgi:2-oxoglutarate dehydrogenase E2 component (dihydrolipoamide succinyltransferase)